MVHLPDPVIGDLWQYYTESNYKGSEKIFGSQALAMCCEFHFPLKCTWPPVLLYPYTALYLTPFPFVPGLTLLTNTCYP